MGQNNLTVIPFFATLGDEGYHAAGLNDRALILLQAASADVRAFVSGVAWSYSLPPTASYTNGALVVGDWYTIQTYVAGDDFVNVGGANVGGTVFQATGLVPTDWTNGSTLIQTGNLKISVLSGPDVTVFEIDITQDGPGQIIFEKALLLSSTDFTSFALSAGGAGCVGKLNLLGVAGTVVFT